MNIYLESVNLDEIRNAAAAGLADGVAFSHTLAAGDAVDANTTERLEEISREFAFVAYRADQPRRAGRPAR